MHWLGIRYDIPFPQLPLIEFQLQQLLPAFAFAPFAAAWHRKLPAGTAGVGWNLKKQKNTQNTEHLIMDFIDVTKSA